MTMNRRSGHGGRCRDGDGSTGEGADAHLTPACHACIGVGGMGYGDLNSFKSHAGLQIVAICDVDKAP